MYPRAPRSPMWQLENAKALAIDWAAPDAMGREEVGNLPEMQRIIRRAVGDLITQRIIRKVVRPYSQDEKPVWGKVGAVVDTTLKDEEEMTKATRGGNNYWYLFEGVSPAVMVLETHDENLAAELLSVINDEESSVVRVFNYFMDPMHADLVLMNGTQPVAALPEKNMSPEDIAGYMEERGITYQFGVEWR